MLLVYLQLLVKMPFNRLLDLLHWVEDTAFPPTACYLHVSILLARMRQSIHTHTISTVSSNKVHTVCKQFATFGFLLSI